MTVQITLIGLGQVGGSIGLALAAHKQTVTRLGHDKNFEAARTAQKAGVVDAVQFNLPASVEQADVVILALPLNEVRETLDFIHADLKEGAVVLDVSPAKRQVETWARELLPPGRFYIGLAPSINPLHMLETGGGLTAARADLFAGAAILVCPQPGAPGEAARLGTDLVRMLGATPILSDSSEADGLLATMSILPKLLAVSLVDATMDRPGWQDAKKLAGRSYAMPVASAFDRDDADSLRETALANRDNVVRVLDGYLASLTELRDNIESADSAAVDETIRKAYKAGYDWLAEHHLERYFPEEKKESKELDESPSSRSFMRQAFLGKLFDRPKPSKRKE
jgi:prephenate dehydrogenase